MGEPREALKVFISYARSDASTFAEELLNGLEVAGFEAFLDRHDIVAGEDWEARLGGLIQSADTVVFAITPSAVGSERCAWEVKKAEALSKRIIPVVAIDVGSAEIPPSLSRLNYILFSQGHSFTRALGELATALRISLAWIRDHTRLAEMAQRWQERDCSDALLLRGAELDTAREWLAEWKAPAPGPTESHRALINASVEAEGVLVKRERKRQARMRIALGAAALLFAALAATSTTFAVEARRYAGEQRATAEREAELRSRADHEAQKATEAANVAYEALERIRAADLARSAALQREARALADSALAQRAAEEASESAVQARGVVLDQQATLRRLRAMGLENLRSLRMFWESPTRSYSPEHVHMVRVLRSQALILGALEMTSPPTIESLNLVLERFYVANSAEHQLELHGEPGDGTAAVQLGYAALQLAGLQGPARSADFGCMPNQAVPSLLQVARRGFEDALRRSQTSDAMRGIACVLQAEGRDAEALRYRQDADRLSGQER